jgi:hypothetical protein
MNVQLLHFTACPHWRTVHARLTEALTRAGLPGQPVELVEVGNDEDAEALLFPGSPTVRLDGNDPFPHADGAHGLTCRVYRTPDGLAGSPTVEQLTEALVAARGPR